VTQSEHPGRRIGLDVGGRRVGVAISDELGLVASPLQTVDLKRGGIDELLRLIEQHQPSEIVVGMPTGMSGREGPQAKAVREFAAKLAERVSSPIYFWDERLTSFAAEQSLIESGHGRERRKQLIDAVAAALMLQGYLESRRR
jgi:putative holliday junction resolvase